MTVGGKRVGNVIGYRARATTTTADGKKIHRQIGRHYQIKAAAEALRDLYARQFPAVEVEVIEVQKRDRLEIV